MDARVDRNSDSDNFEEVKRPKPVPFYERKIDLLVGKIAELEEENQRLHAIFKSVGVPMTARAFMDKIENLRVAIVDYLEHRDLNCDCPHKETQVADIYELPHKGLDEADKRLRRAMNG